MDSLVALKQNYEFRRVYDKGKSCVSSAVVTYCLKKKYGGVRIGITTGKKIGCAVKRNRARRVIRAAARPLLNNVSGNWDIVFVARTPATFVKSTDIQSVLEKHLKQLNVLL